MESRVKKLFKIIILYFMSFQVFALTSYKLPSATKNFQIDVFSICKSLANTSSANYIIPTGTAADWTAFLAHPPAGVTVNNCGPSVGLYGGKCSMVGFSSVCVSPSTGKLCVYSVGFAASAGTLIGSTTNTCDFRNNVTCQTQFSYQVTGATCTTNSVGISCWGLPLGGPFNSWSAGAVSPASCP